MKPDAIMEKAKKVYCQNENKNIKLLGKPTNSGVSNPITGK